MRALSLAILCLVAVGCRVDPNIVLLERENRELEDRVYQLEDALAKAQTGLDLCQGTSTSPPSVVRPEEPSPPSGIAGPALTAPQQRSPRQPDVGSYQPPKVLIPPEENQAPGRLSSPPAWPGSEKSPPAGQRNGSALPRDTDRQPAPPQSRRPTPSAASRTVNSTVPAEVTKDNNRIQQITLHPLLTGGYNADGRPGHEGITTLVELRDAKGRPLNTAAPISVAVVDKAVPGAASRVARWDYSAQEVASQWRKTPMGEGFLLRTLWPSNPPSHGQLRLFVRLTTDDGRNLDAVRDIEVRLADPASVGWSPASPKELPPQDRPAVPLAQENPRPTSPSAPPPSSPAAERPSSPALASQPPQAEPVEAAAAPILELPGDVASAPEETPSRDPPRQAAQKRPAIPETALQRPAWSPYRR